MLVTSSGSVRVDLVGGTLDIEPINLILKNAITLNVATELMAQVKVSKIDLDGIDVHSSDYHKNYRFQRDQLSDENILYTDQFKEMSFILQILRLFGINSHLKIELTSGAPAGSGLGGSSAMGVTLYKALCDYTGKKYDRNEAVLRVKAVESRILNQGVAGFQDYYPALMGGILGIKGIEGEIKVEQLFSSELKNFLEKHLTLIYSGQSRSSGINNWEVYKGFFDKRPEVVQGLQEIADISHQTYLSLKAHKWDQVLELISLEGKSRLDLFPGVTTQKIHQFMLEMKKNTQVLGYKMCGAGGGGCFILVHKGLDQSVIKEKTKAYDMKILPFKILPPLE